MKSVLVCNQKGGVGKSLIADELAFSFERSGIPYSFYDLDSQGGTIHVTNDVEGAVIQVIDTPGALQRAIMQWMEEADIVMIPFRPTSRDIQPLLRMMDIAEQHANGKPVLYVLNAWNRYRASKDFEEWFAEQSQGKMQLLTLPQSEQFVRASAEGRSVVDYAPRGAAAAAMKQVTNWVRLMLDLPSEPVMPMEGA